MHTPLKVLSAALLLISASACSRQQAIGLDAATGKQRIYVMDDREADAIAHGAILSSFPGRKVETITGPMRGYSTYTRMMLDTFTQQVLIQPVTGQKADGTSVDGYTFEVSGSGTSIISGQAQNINFGNTLQKALDSTGKAVEVVSVHPRAVVPSSSISGTSEVEKSLVDLRKLLDQGLITPAEYENKRSSVLNRI